ncbi:MAG: M23 family metallopeptidase [Polyangiaceae bacterium]
MNAFFAIDLASPYEQPPAIVRAAADGVAYVFPEGAACATPPGRPAHAEPSTCGDSWGNQVKIYHGDGVVSFYVHLASVSVRSRQRVRAGDELGVEGWTGAAGHRHLHFSVQRLPGNNESEWLTNISASGTSLPFRMASWVDGQRILVDTTDFRCPHANIGFADGQPRLRGVQ